MVVALRLVTLSLFAVVVSTTMVRAQTVNAAFQFDWGEGETTIAAAHEITHATNATPMAARDVVGGLHVVWAQAGAPTYGRRERDGTKWIIVELPRRLANVAVVGPTIGSDGNAVYAAWLEGDAVILTRSIDGGISWASPFRLATKATALTLCAGAKSSGESVLVLAWQDMTTNSVHTTGWRGGAWGAEAFSSPVVLGVGAAINYVLDGREIQSFMTDGAYRPSVASAGDRVVIGWESSWIGGGNSRFVTFSNSEDGGFTWSSPNAPLTGFSGHSLLPFYGQLVSVALGIGRSFAYLIPTIDGGVVLGSRVQFSDFPVSSPFGGLPLVGSARQTAQVAANRFGATAVVWTDTSAATSDIALTRIAVSPAPPSGLPTTRRDQPAVIVVDEFIDLFWIDRNGAEPALQHRSARIVPKVPSRLINLSIRSQVGEGDRTLTVGFVANGSLPALMRGVGPTLVDFGVRGSLADPTLTVFSGAKVVAANDNWSSDATPPAGLAGSFPLRANSADAALRYTLGAGAYTLQIDAKGGSGGVALAEVYDLVGRASFTAAMPKLSNFSARSVVGVGADVLIAGFTIDGDAPKRVLVRAAGPALAGFGVNGFLADPKLELFNSSARKVGANDNWGGGEMLAGAFSVVGAFGFPRASSDAALIVSLAPGSYTAQVSGAGKTTGVALVEVYELP